MENSLNTQEKPVLQQVIRKWLLENLQTKNEPSQLPAKDIFDSFMKNNVNTNISFRTFNLMVKETFSSANINYVRINSVRTKVFSNLVWDKENCVPLGRNTNFRNIATKFGYQLVEKEDVISFMKITDQEYNGHYAIKELTFVVDTGNTMMRVAGKRTSLTPDDIDPCLSEADLSYMLTRLSTYNVCKGFIITPDMGIIGPINSDIWTTGGSEYLRSDNCAGITVKDICMKCSKKLSNLKNKFQSRKIEIDHSYCISTYNKITKEKAVKSLDFADDNTVLCEQIDLSDWLSCSEDDVSEMDNDPDYECTSNNKTSQLKLTSNKFDKVRSCLLEAAPELSDQFLALVESQISNSRAADQHQRKWDIRTLQVCLGVWLRSPHAYDQLRRSKMLLMPSTRQLRRYKNSVQQNPGFSDDMFDWMRLEANRQGVSVSGRVGGIILDEMSIQPELEFTNNRADSTLIGFTDAGTESETIQKLRYGSPKLASHVLQFIFLGDEGFRWPFAHFPTVEINASQLYVIFWDAVAKLQEWDFQVNFVCMDGSVHNRTFQKMHFKGPPVEENFTAVNRIDRKRKMVFLMDPSHEFKKIRNSLYQSSPGGKKSVLLNGHNVSWKHFTDAYEWDLATNQPRLHYKLTPSHLHPDQGEKMRNRLANEVLGLEMLLLFEAYKNHSKRTDLESTIKLLNQTSTLLKIFQDHRPIRSYQDTRVQQLTEVVQFMQDWHTEWEKHGKKREHFITWESYDDMMSMLCGTRSIIELKLKEYPLSSICLHRLNSDVVENIFCSQRSVFNGANTNPSYNRYCKSLSAVIMSQPLKSKVSNAGGKHTISGALPYKSLIGKSYNNMNQ